LRQCRRLAAEPTEQHCLLADAQLGLHRRAVFQERRSREYTHVRFEDKTPAGRPSGDSVHVGTFACITLIVAGIVGLELT
jgi:hypothetical protein